jgi:hypothetical protein
MNAFKITLPLGVATCIAGLVIGFSSITLAPSTGAGCGSAFDPGTGTLNTNIEVACAPIVAERDSWATALLFVGFALLASSAILFGTANRAAQATVWPHEPVVPREQVAPSPPPREPVIPAQPLPREPVAPAPPSKHNRPLQQPRTKKTPTSKAKAVGPGAESELPLNLGNQVIVDDPQESHYGNRRKLIGGLVAVLLPTGCSRAKNTTPPLTPSYAPLTPSYTTLTGTQKPWLNLTGAFTGSLPSGGNLNYLGFNDLIVGDTTGSFPNVIKGFQLLHVVASPAAGPRNAMAADIIVNSVGATTNPFSTQYVALEASAKIAGNLGGTALAPQGAIWGGNFTAFMPSAATYMSEITGIEIDVEVDSGANIDSKYGLAIGLAGNDAVRGSHDDIGLTFAKPNSATGTWQNGIMFGKNQAARANSAYTSWPFDATSTMITTCVNDGPGTGLPANIGIDFSRVIFSGPAIKTGAAPIALSEMASAPSAVAGEGFLYVASDGSLHYRGPTTDTRLAPA